MFRKEVMQPAGHAGAFTLIELLVSMAVLSVIVVLIAQLFASATTLTVNNRKHLDADSQARLVFDHLSLDLGKMLKRTDVDYLFAKIDGVNSPGNSQGTNDKMFFYSEAPAYYDNTGATGLNLKSPLALVGYRINKAYQLERLGKQLTWDGTVSAATANNPATPGGIMFLSPKTAGANPAYNLNLLSTLSGNWPSTIGKADESPAYSGSDPSDDDYQVLADRVCRMEFCFQLKNGNYSPIPVSTIKDINNPDLTQRNKDLLYNNLSAAAPPTAQDDNKKYMVGARWYDNSGARGYVCAANAQDAAVWNFIGMQDVQAVVVALAIIDETSTKAIPTSEVTMNGLKFQVPKIDDLVHLLADADTKDITVPGNASPDLTIPNFALMPPTDRPRLPAEAWSNEIATPDFPTNSHLSRSVVSQIRIYQRSFALNNQ